MEYSLTIFNSVFDNKTHRRMTFDSWEKFEKLMFQLSKQPGYKPSKGDRRQGSSLISPAVYAPDTTRKNINVLSWAGWCALDVDDYPGKTFEEAIEIFKGYKHICYSSASSSIEHPKCRIIFPLTAEVKQDDIKHFWYALNKKFNSLGDPQTKDLSRMYYIPARYENCDNHFITSNSDGIILDPAKIMGEYEFISNSGSNSMIPDAIQEQLLKYKKATQLVNTDISWKSYRDCPFVNRTLLAQYLSISTTGWYGKFYQLMIAVAGNAVRMGYPITPYEIASICREIDADTGGWYDNRPIESESARALEWAYRKVL